MKKTGDNILKDILRFLNDVPNNAYGDNYLLASRLEKLIEVLPEAITLLENLRKDALMALRGEWDPTGEGQEGFEAQIILIDKTLSKLKEV